MTLRSELIDYVWNTVTVMVLTIMLVLSIHEGLIIGVVIATICLAINMVLGVRKIIKLWWIIEILLKRVKKSLQKKNNEVILKSSQNEYKSDRKEQKGI